jgi:hypothetical protein
LEQSSPVSDEALGLSSSTSRALVLTTLFGMALLGPRPSGFSGGSAAWRSMFWSHYAGLELKAWFSLLALTAIGGLAPLLGSARRHAGGMTTACDHLLPATASARSHGGRRRVRASGVSIKWERCDAGVLNVEK